MLTDSHCHLASHRFSAPEIAGLLERAHAAGVHRLVTLATSLDDLHANLTLAENPVIHACIGIHPCDVHHAPPDAIDQLAAFTADPRVCAIGEPMCSAPRSVVSTADPRVCAIGETGLDFYHPAPDGWDEQSWRNCQREFLRRHFDLAGAAGLNVVIHTRDQSGHASFEEALMIYRDFHTTVRAVFHCFSGPWENAKRVLDLGGLVSFGGVATFNNARKVRATASKCPAGSFMVETDAPYLAPEPHRGMRNEPAFVRDTAAFLAELRGESLDVFAHHTEKTAAEFFRFRSAAN